MDDLTPRYSATIDADRREPHFTTSGFFDVKAMQGLQQEIGKAAAPLLADRKPFRAFGDLSGYVVQSREISEEMTNVQRNAEKIGIERVAILITKALVRMQYQRVAEGQNVQIFETGENALEWLRTA